MKSAFYKQKLNTCFGKFSSNFYNSKTDIVSSQNQLEVLASKHEIIALDQITPSTLSVTYSMQQRSNNQSTNLYIASHINSFARIFIYKSMMSLVEKGAKIFAVDTDAIMYSLPLRYLTQSLFHFCWGNSKYIWR